MSTPRRFFAEKLNYPEEREVVLDGEEFIHAKTVLRVAAGDEIVLLDGAGKEYSAVVQKVEKSRLIAHVTGDSLCDKEPQTAIYLMCGFLKNADKNELIVQKATELGAGGIAFFSSEYSSAYMNKNKLERLKKVAREATKQCLRACAPKIEYFPDFAAALKSAEGFENKLFACEFAGKSEIWLSKLCGATVLVVGSEGGFSEKEYMYAKSLGFKGISLGKRILRAETAAVALCTLTAYALGELE